MTSQNQKKPEPSNPETEVIEIEFGPVPISAPPIEMEKVAQVLAQAQKAKTERRHTCRCHDPNCNHFERIDLDTGEAFETPLEEPGYVDKDGYKRR